MTWVDRLAGRRAGSQLLARPWLGVVQEEHWRAFEHAADAAVVASELVDDLGVELRRRT
jgi:hypothetical protein